MSAAEPCPSVGSSQLFFVVQPFMSYSFYYTFPIFLTSQSTMEELKELGRTLILYTFKSKISKIRSQKKIPGWNINLCMEFGITISCRTVPRAL